jgi:hypothetical protein
MGVDRARALEAIVRAAIGAADTTFLVEADRKAVEVTDEIGYTAFHGPAG